ncbi:hypothetical protein [Thermomonospora umbrina]|uniref:Uncharacterized protein n=1 Tax=Thermomonospora umbrina TaxID=111806 RepID=A0A3D9SXR1_9ACTN|nr:hypothetical protein [Thermomonospora umbrina]REE96391.1 hypothetical protein DFJ69_1824 [Thermomonospora umbrina]
MSARTLLAAIAAVGLLLMGLTAGLVRAHEGAPPSLGGAIEVTGPATPGARVPRPPEQAAAVPGPSGPSGPSAGPRPLEERDEQSESGGRAVPPPGVPVYGGGGGDDDDDDDGDD